jgi:predicted nucleic acid-binding protein
MARLLADTCVLIDLDRRNEAAQRIVAQYADDELCLCPIVAGEYMAGLSERIADARKVVMAFRHYNFGPRTAEIFGIQASRLRLSGSMIGINDLWIASIAIDRGVPILTRNTREFERIPELDVRTY